MGKPTVFSVSSTIFSQHGGFTSHLVREGAIDLVNYLVCPAETFQAQFANADRGKGPFRVDDAVRIRHLDLPATSPLGEREIRNRAHLAATPPAWDGQPQVMLLSQQCRLDASAKTLFPDPPRVVLYAEFFVPSDIACRPEWPLHPSMRPLMDRWRAKSMADAAHADAIIVPSAYARSCWPEEVRHKVHAIYDGVDTDHLAPERIATLSDYGPRLRRAHRGKRLVAYIGRTIESIRGFDTWMKAYLHLRSARPDLHFLVLGQDKTIQRGGGSEYYYGIKSFKTYVLDSLGLKEEDLDDITWIPYLGFFDYLSLLSVLDVALYPMYGMFGNWSLFQALHMGVPIVASDRAYLPEVFRHGDNGYLADPDDSAAFADLALTILDRPDRGRALRQRATETIAARYSVRVAARQFAALLTDLGVPVPGPATATATGQTMGGSVAPP